METTEIIEIAEKAVAETTSLRKLAKILRAQLPTEWDAKVVTDNRGFESLKLAGPDGRSFLYDERGIENLPWAAKVLATPKAAKPAKVETPKAARSEQTKAQAPVVTFTKFDGEWMVRGTGLQLNRIATITKRNGGTKRVYISAIETVLADGTQIARFVDDPQTWQEARSLRYRLARDQHRTTADDMQTWDD